MHKRRILLALSVTAWIASASFADPKILIDTSIQTGAHASASLNTLDRDMNQMWNNQQQLVSTMVDSGLLNAADQHDHYHDHGTGMGGEYGQELSMLSESDDDVIQNKINSITTQAQARQDSLDKLSESLTITRTYRELGSGSSNQSSLNVGTGLLAVEPVANARVSSTFGYRSMFGRTEYHSGLDLAAPTGTPIYATADGVVTKSGWGRGYGNYVEIDHGNGLVTRYGHASRLLVSVGETVKVNQQIAAVGCTGRCTGPHLHYEVVKNGERQNPATYLALAPKRED
jgi:murein DD-endopeptidase MepM/ murein hydrolase activator NlpD